jgi:L-threonylcarbamoyladenylate synthase
MEHVINTSQRAHERARRIVKSGGVIAYRTDTFYGLGVDPFNSEGVQRIKDLKGREDNKPILIVISDAIEADRFISERSSLFEIASSRHWPGALTLVLNASACVPDELTAGTGTIGVRLPDDTEVSDLVRACGGALTATSANPSGAAPARTAIEVAEYFPTGVDLIIDSGAARSEKPSTVLDVSGDVPRVIREGLVECGDLLPHSTSRCRT